MDITHNEIKKTIIKSQHCQRNWDLTKEISKDDLELMVHAVTQCPSKQNIANYKVHVITDRTLINKIHEKTYNIPYKVKEGTEENAEYYQDPYSITEQPKLRIEDQDKYDGIKFTTNSQVQANVLFAFEDYISPEPYWNKLRITEPPSSEKNIHLGIAAGYLNLTASMLGYSTGCCVSYDHNEVTQILGTDNKVLLLMGIGYPRKDMNRRDHPTLKNFQYTTFKKQNIPVMYYK